jgi:hypothetical protein
MPPYLVSSYLTRYIVATEIPYCKKKTLSYIINNEFYLVKGQSPGAGCTRQRSPTYTAPLNILRRPCRLGG